jgi:formate hydrogenlyase subunit 4
MIVVYIVLIVLISLFFPGVISKVKAKIGARKGPKIIQVLFDNIRLLKKGSVYSVTTSAVFKIAPLVYFATIALGLFFIPFGNYKAILSFDCDFVLFSYALAMGKFFMIAAAMDTGSGFEGMGANREAYYSMLVEPAFFVVIASLALFTGNTSFYDLFTNFTLDSTLSYFVAALFIYIFLWIAMVENSRMPVDDPKTHLELTMVHEVMVLDFSGFDLGLIQLSNGLKFTIYGALMFNIISPVELAIGWQFLIFIVLEFVLAIAVGLIESFRARNKMMKNPQWIISLSALAIVAFFTALIITGKFILI